VHHLKALLPDPRNTVVLVGFQAAGTHGRALAEGAAQLKIHGQYVKVRAEVVDVAVFSVHGDADELMAWLKSAGKAPPSVFVVHGEMGSSTVFAKRVREELDVCAVVPKPGERVRV
jgi:metallo-beta-lactamase family protein